MASVLSHRFGGLGAAAARRSRWPSVAGMRCFKGYPSQLCRFSGATGTPLDAIVRTANAVCFDVDSTIIAEEGIDVLAKHYGCERPVSEATSQAMNGEMLFQDAMRKRLSIILPSAQGVASLVSSHPVKFTPGVQEFIAHLHGRGVEVFLVSGGFRLMIEPVRAALDVPEDNVFANTIFFDEKGEYAGFDESELTSRDGGKAEVVAKIKAERGFKTVIMVGDGATDMQAKPPADAFIGYGGVVERETVRKGADIFVTSFFDLLNMFKEAEQRG